MSKKLKRNRGNDEDPLNPRKKKPSKLERFSLFVEGQPDFNSRTFSPFVALTLHLELLESNYNLNIIYQIFAE